VSKQKEVRLRKKERNKEKKERKKERKREEKKEYVASHLKNTSYRAEIN
jgi:hypothetical protein